MGLAWLGQRLARQGFISVAVNHHGNTSVEPYRAEGFLCLWERARDLTVLLNLISSDDFFRDYIDMKQVFVGGFSAGAYTALLLLGAIVHFSQYEPSTPIQNASPGPREFPDLAIQLPGLLENSAMFRGSWARMSSDYRDRRFKAALLCAPGRSVLGFSETSLGQIDLPVRIFVGDSDTIAPAQECASWLQKRLRTSSLEVLSPNAGHYVFLPEATAATLQTAPEAYPDAPGVNRQAIHERVANSAAALFQQA